MTERVNIRRIETVEERQKAFDVKKDLTSQHWARMDEVMQSLMTPDSIGLELEFLSLVKIIDPDRALPIRPFQLSDIVEKVADMSDYAYILGDAHLRIVDRTRSLTMTLLNMDVEKIYREIKDVEYSVARFLAAVRILDPKIDLSFAEESIEPLGKSISALGESKNWKSYVKFRALARIAGIDSTMPLPRQEQWTDLCEYFETLRHGSKHNNGDVLDLIEVAASMKILAAGSVRVTENGIELSPPAPIAQERSIRKTPHSIEL